jgi:hypothetical protein
MRVSETGKRIQLENERLTISFNLSSEPGPLAFGGSQRWFAGAATSVRYRDYQGHDNEMLDLFRHALSNYRWMGHDPEKRCMQVQRLTLFDPQVNTAGYATIDVSDREYSRVAVTSDDEECSVLVQCRLDFPAASYGTKTHETSHYYLNRRVTLKKLTSYVREDISVTKTGTGAVLGQSEDMNFAVEFFAHMDMSLAPTIAKDLAQGWYSVGFTGGHSLIPRFAHGFACSGDTAIVDFITPVPSFSEPTGSHKAFAWRTAPCQHLKAIHLFTFGDEADVNGALIRRLRLQESSMDI